MDIGKMGHVLFEEDKNCYKLGKAPWRELGTDGRIILIWIIYLYSN